LRCGLTYAPETDMEKKTIEVIIGKNYEGSVTDKSIFTGLRTPAFSGEARGRDKMETVMHFCCGSFNWVYVKDHQLNIFQCWNCGGLFTVMG